MCPKDQLPRTAASAAGIHATFTLDHTVLWILTIYLWWVLWISMYETRRSSSFRYKDLALGWGGVSICVEGINLT